VYDKPGNYTVSLTIADPDGRTSAKVQQVKIQSTKLKLAVTGADVITCSKEPVSLKADGGKTYQWSPCTGLSDCTSPTPLVIPGMHDRYTVRVTDRNGCTDTASVIVRYVDPAKDIFIPNAFTPNGDGLNDTFKPLANIGIPGPHEVQIVNRFGSKVFASSNPLIGWDGTTQGKPAPTGTYSYLIRVKGEGKCATKNITGTVMLIR
jgi:gliding motility-associated-like protein